ncbi:MAG: BTAD domain-containing putative transcriptional regulator [Candidatus Limiplasma sp.]|nr:BTAD domain-containing putative transcriptional regulator [Candidatus Limiplasma sp.]
MNENEYIWSQNKGDEYAALYHQLVAEMCKQYTGNHDYTSAESILQKALKLEPIDDSLNEMLLDLYLQKQDKAAFVKHYKKIKTVYNDELGIELNSKMRDLYHRASKL